MVLITGYKKVNYSEFQTALHRSFADCGKAWVDIASEVHVKTPITVKNAFKTDKQIVSDEVLTSIMNSVGLEGGIWWNKTERNYYIKSKTNNHAPK